MNSKTLLIPIILLLIIINPLYSTVTHGVDPPTIDADDASSDPYIWTSIDTSDRTVDVVGEKIGSLQGQPFAGWYTDTAVVDPATGTVIVAWARWNVDEEGSDLIFMAFMRPVDADGDGSPEAYQKIVKFVDSATNLKSLDSLTLGGGYVLLTWTYYDSTYKNNVKAALYSIDGTFQWKGNVRSTTEYEEYSRSCYVAGYNSGAGGFLIVWYTTYDNSIDGKWLYYSSTAGWTLTSAFDIAGTNDLYYTKADQMLCIGGSSKALVVFRKWDSVEGYPDLYAALVDTSNNVKEVKLYDYNGAEETVGVRGAYGSNLFLVPLVSGTHVRYDIIAEADGTVYNRDYVTSNGAHPYAIYAGNRFVLGWIDYYNDNDGEPKVANIDTSQFYIHPIYGVSITGGDSYSDKHPLLSFYMDGSAYKLLYIWSSYTGSDYDIKYAIVSLHGPTESPSVDSVGVLVSGGGSQEAHGLGAINNREYVVAYTDTSDGEEDLLAYVTLPDSEEVQTITLYKLPEDAVSYKQKILDLINNAQSRVYVAVAYFQEENPGDTGTISKALVDAKNRGVDVRVIIDDDVNNKAMYDYLNGNGVPIIDDSTATDEYHIMHDKFMIVDGYKLVVSTVNFIPDDFNKNNNTAIYMESKVVAYFYEQEFLHMWNNGNGLFGTGKTDDHSFIAFATYSATYPERLIVFEGYFSPQEYGDRARIPSEILGFLTRAEDSIFFASYIFTTSYFVTPMYNAIVDAYSDGKNVIGVFDELMNVDVPGRRLYWFIDNNVPVAIDNHKYKMHAKLCVIDNITAILGSWNPTKSATTVHDENILVIRDFDSDNGFAKEIADYIASMYNSNVFVKSPYHYTPTHLVITKVMFKPDDTGQPNAEWVEIYNPTSESIDLSNYVIGDSDNLLDGDNEGMYKFPNGATIPPDGYVVVAYNATEFYNKYGFYPNYEIAGDDPTVPDLTSYDTSKFTGSWDLNDDGDEVILAEDQDGFLQVVDAVWYGSSTYMTTSIGQPNSAAPLDTSNVNPGDGIVNMYLTGEASYLDAIILADKYTIEPNPQPVPEPIIVAAVIAVILVGYLAVRAKANSSKTGSKREILNHENGMKL